MSCFRILLYSFVIIQYSHTVLCPNETVVISRRPYIPQPKSFLECHVKYPMLLRANTIPIPTRVPINAIPMQDARPRPNSSSLYLSGRTIKSN